LSAKKKLIRYYFKLRLEASVLVFLLTGETKFLYEQVMNKQLVMAVL
jgi:hypothetical protein